MGKTRLRAAFIGILLGLIGACGHRGGDSAILPPAPVGAQALALTGPPLVSADPAPEVRDKYEAARSSAEAAPDDADKLIWHGRWAAYAGDYREAIRIFTRGIKRFPGDARFLRHRGHRYISIRAFDRAVRDLEKAASLVKGKPDEIEPDGNPNPRGIPVSTLHSNIDYHLGLAYYLSRDLQKALAVYRRAMATAPNDDMRVATAHWLYMTLRRLGRPNEAKAVLEPVRQDMDIVENAVYHQLCLFYKGELGEEAIAGPAGEATTNDAAAYGLGNWRLYNGDAAGAQMLFRRILEGRSWASFGYIAAEAEVAWAMIH
jgi:tetratricopeptide (TPR) repeat protein